MPGFLVLLVPLLKPVYHFPVVANFRHKVVETAKEVKDRIDIPFHKLGWNKRRRHPKRQHINRQKNFLSETIKKGKKVAKEVGTDLKSEVLKSKLKARVGSALLSRVWQWSHKLGSFAFMIITAIFGIMDSNFFKLICCCCVTVVCLMLLYCFIIMIIKTWRKLRSILTQIYRAPMDMKPYFIGSWRSHYVGFFAVSLCLNAHHIFSAGIILSTCVLGIFVSAMLIMVRSCTAICKKLHCKKFCVYSGADFSNIIPLIKAIWQFLNFTSFITCLYCVAPEIDWNGFLTFLQKHSLTTYNQLHVFAIRHWNDEFTHCMHGLYVVFLYLIIAILLCINHQKNVEINELRNKSISPPKKINCCK